MTEFFKILVFFDKVQFFGQKPKNFDQTDRINASYKIDETMHDEMIDNSDTAIHT